MKHTFIRWLTAVLLLLTFIALAAAFALPTLRDDADAGEITPQPQVIIDPGHGGEDGGAVGADGTVEKELNLSISRLLRDMLTASGVKVLMTRTEDTMLYDKNADYHGRKKQLDLSARMQLCRDDPDALFVSIHMNSFPQKKYDGLQVYYPAEDAVAGALARDIQAAVKASLQPQNMRRAKASAGNIFLLKNNPCHAVLIECGFLSNDAECARLRDAAYQKELARLIHDSIMKYLSGTLQSS